MTPGWQLVGTRPGEDGVLRLLWLSMLYLLGAWFAGVLILAPDEVTLFWPASGVAYAAVLRYGPRWSLFVAIPILLNHTLFAPVPAGFLPYSVGSNIVAALAGYAICRSLTKDTARLSVRSGFALMCGAVTMSATSAMIGTLGLLANGMTDGTDFWHAFARWTMGDLLGITCVAPTLLYLTHGDARDVAPLLGDRMSAHREKAIWLACTILSAGIFYIAGTYSGLYSLGLVSLPLALLLWSAVRFEPLWTLVGTGIAVLVITSITALGIGAFRSPQDPFDVALLLGFMCLFANVPLMLTASIAEQRAATRRALQRAVTDSATGLPNRSAFEEALQRTAARAGAEAGLVYLDLDHLSLINDTVGSAAGDALIQGAGSLLRATVDRHDEVFRIGGDEFALLLHGSPAYALRTAERVLLAIDDYRVGWQGQALNATASIGLVTFVGGHGDHTHLLSQADTACFTAKELGGNRICIANQEPGELQERTAAMRWAVRIREALDRGLFELDCQSIQPLDGDAGQGRHFELLLRMRDPVTGQRLAPGDFIPAAERFQLGVQLDRHVIELALGWLEARPAAAAEVHLCAINLTAASMVDEGFQRYVVDRVRRSSVPAHKLCFEITETSAVRDLARAQALIAQLHALGCAFALDDFGTGFCSFNYLRSLDVDYFKIDGSFVRDLQDSELSTAVVRSITDIAHVLHKKTIAEQVENEQVIALLRALGVDMAQGYGLHRPEPLAQYFARNRIDTRAR
jgi:diguanylate cyclase (GGDEF)-like protein